MPSRKNNASNIILRSPLPSYDANNGEKGCNICGFCNICVCLRWGFLSSPTGILKAIELVASLLCQLLCYGFGVKYSTELGIAFCVIISASGASCVTAFILLLTYLSSEKSFYRVRPSTFEALLGLLLCFMFLASSSSLVYQVHKNLFYYYNTIPGFHAYPAMTITYIVGFVIGIVHGVDSLLAFRAMRSVK